MEILPAIDMRDGHAVRLSQGDYDQQTTYSDDPAAIAQTFAQAGANWIHMVDLDAARSGVLTNTEMVKAVRQAVDLKLELGGGARSEDTVRQMLDLGVDRVIIGSAALKDWAWFEALVAKDDLAGKIVLGLDARNDKLAVNGWTEQVEASPLEIAHRVNGWPLAAIVYTDIARDGMFTGINIESTSQLIANTDVPIIGSGGVGSLDDIVACKTAGCWGTIVGKAWYEGKVDIAEACRISE